MHGFSPFTRRGLALAILLLLVIAAVNLALAIGSGVASSMSELEDARFRLARLAALQQRPAPRMPVGVPADLYFRAPDHHSAAQQVGATLASVAASTQLPLENLAIQAPDDAAPSNVVINLAAAGPEGVVLEFINVLERSRPAVRLTEWNIVRTGVEPASLRLEATATAAWSARP